MSIGSAKYPSDVAYQSINLYPDLAYEMYKMSYPNEHHVDPISWLYRYGKMRFDFRGNQDLFTNMPRTVDEGGVTTSNLSIQLNGTIQGIAEVNPKSQLYALVYHHIPTFIICDSKNS